MKKFLGIFVLLALCVGLFGQTELFISEYVEGSSYNKAIEIYNGTGATVNLTSGNYSIEIYSNGSTSSTEISLEGSVADGDVFILAQGGSNSADQSILDVADQSTPTSLWNGDDAVVLSKNGTIIDVIGKIGQRTEWGSGLISTKDNTIRRKASIISGDINGNDDFEPSIEWDGYAKDTFDGLGSHSVSGTPTDNPPTVSSTTPADSDTDVSLSSNIEINFDEDVTVTGAWYQISGSTSGSHTVTVSGGPQSFTLNPDADFSKDETVTVTVYAAQIADQDGTANNMDSDYTFSFTAIGNQLPEISSIGHSPTTVLASTGAEVSADVADNDGFISTVSLLYRINSSSTSTPIVMVKDLTQTGYTTNSDIPGQVAGTVVYYNVVATDNEGGVSTSPDQSYTVQASIKAEPTNHVTAFTATASGSSSITLTWTENDGAVVPDSYLIKASTADNVSAPSDANTVSDNTTIGDNSGAINISHGTATYTWTGLTASTTYYFEIYPYTNLGAAVDYKIDGTIPGDNDATSASSGYYSTAIGLSGVALKAELHEIIDDHVEYPYTSSSTDVWDILKDTDRDPSNPSNVIQLYTGNSVPDTEYPVWNREHVWAKSHGGFGENPPAGTDAHHLRPADPGVNSTRNNLDFDNGGTLVGGTSDCYIVAGTSFEPRDAVKGDVARMMFYMVVRYEGEEGYDLELVDNVGTSGPLFGKLSTLIEWHNSDPVDAFELNRNEVVYGYQGNRNPFIDHPEWVSSIWGGGSGATISNVAYSPDAPLSSQPVIVTADVVDNTNTITSVTLKYGTDEFNLTNSVSMTNTSGSTYSAVIPAQSHSSIIYYVVEAVNDVPVTSVTETAHFLVFDPQTATLPYLQEFETSFGDMYRYDVDGDREWGIYAGGGYTGDCARFTEFSGYSQANVDWMITPGFDLTGTSDEYLSFLTSKNYDPLPLMIKYSTNYPGYGDPTTSTWSDITSLTTLSTTNDGAVWVNSGDIDFSSINSSNVHIAFIYQSTTVTNGYWKIDDVSLKSVNPVSISPTISNIVNTPAVPQETDPVVVSATITDNGTITSATLNWGLSSGSLSNPLVMANVGNVYSATLPAQAQGATVYYTITAIDNDVNSTTTPEASYSIFQPGMATIPYSQVFASDLGDWTAESVTGSQTWIFEPSYGNPAGCAKVSGYEIGVSYENEDWLISPGFNLNNQSSEILSFENAYNYDGNQLELWYSTDYSGTGSPNVNGSWTQISSVNWSTGSWNFVNSGDIDISGISGTQVYFAFKYTSTSSQSSTWEIDNISITVNAGSNPEITSIDHTPDSPSSSDIVAVTATITDDGSVASATINWGTSSGSLGNSALMSNVGDDYAGNIPAQTVGTEVFYTVSATDNESNSTTSTEKSYTVTGSSTISGFAQSFEGTANDNWNYSTLPAQFTSGSDIWDIVDDSWQSSNLATMSSDGIKFFGIQDLYNSNGGTPNLEFGTINFEQVDVSGYSDLSVAFDYDIYGFDLSNGDEAKYEIFINGISQGEVVLTVTGTVNGNILFNIPDETSTVSLVVSIKQDGGSDYAGFDNFKIIGTPKPTLNAWINEIHYDNAGTDAGEAVEVVIENASSYDLSLFVITLYNGNGGSSYGTHTLNTFAQGASDGNFTYFSALISGIQNGGPDGIALSYDGELIQFLSYEGSFTAVGGIADGQTSEDIGVSEPSTTPIGQSLQLTGSGTKYSDFTWAAPMTETFGSANAGGDQSLPVELSQFTATFQNGVVELNWITESEVNNLGFNVYRSTNDEENYHNINGVLIEGAGNSSEANDYYFTDSEIVPGNRYSYKIEDVSNDGQKEMHGPVTVQTEKSDDQIANSYALGNAYPNPFNPETTITYEIPEECTVKINIYDIQGNLVSSLVNTVQNAGNYKVTWHGTDNNSMKVGNGVYFYQMTTNTGFAKTAKVIFLK